MKASTSSTRLYLAGLVLLALAGLVFVQAAFDLRPFISPSLPSQILLFYSLSTIVFVVLTVFAFVLARSLFKLIMERRSGKPGAHFQTRLVMSMIVITLIPAIALFAFAFGLVNRSIDKWFSVPVDTIFQTASEIQSRWAAEHASAARGALLEIAADFPEDVDRTVENMRLDAVALFDREGTVRVQSTGASSYLSSFRERLAEVSPASEEPLLFTRTDGRLIGVVPLQNAGSRQFVAAAFQPPEDFQELTRTIASERLNYQTLIEERVFYRDTYVYILVLMTILVLFAAVWTGLFMSKRITVPIQALSGATREISAGNLQHRVEVQAEDELGMLVSLFNDMAGQLQLTREELEERRRYTETILEAIPTGVISIDEEYRVTKINRAARTMFGIEKPDTLEEFLRSDDLGRIGDLLRLCRQEGTATVQMTLQTPHATTDTKLPSGGVLSAVIASRLTAGGFVIVIEDLTEVAKAQKATAWREVARRLAHEIKNPLTPIQLSAERIARNIDRTPALDAHTRGIVRECVESIVGEVRSLKELVNEFGRVARLPAISKTPTSIQRVVDRTLALYEDRLNGTRILSEIPEDLPDVMIDPQQIKRVLINLIDNALEAMAETPDRELRIACSLVGNESMLRLSIADNGHGIRPEDQERLFTPYFTTRPNGTGLGLAIASRIVSDHGGSIGVESNGAGAHFVVELPVWQES